MNFPPDIVALFVTEVKKAQEVAQGTAMCARDAYKDYMSHPSENNRQDVLMWQEWSREASHRARSFMGMKGN